MYNSLEIPNPEYCTTNPLVLVGEDDADARQLLATLLGISGFGVVEACDGEEVVAVAQRELPDLILIDLELPLLDGVEATRRIREQSALDSAAIIFMSGHAEQDFRTVALEAGGDEYLVKPIDFDQLGNILTKHLQRNRQSLGNDVDNGQN